MVYPHLEPLVSQYGQLVVGYCSQRVLDACMGKRPQVHLEKTAAECARFVKRNPDWFEKK